MSTESHKVQIVAEVDASPAKAGFEEVKAAGRDMAQSVDKSGKQAGESIKGLGDGADPAAQKLDRATKSIIASIQRSTAAMQAGGQANSQYFESIAQQRGINVDVLRPYLKGLDDAVAKNAAMNQAMHGSTVSAKQLQQALQGVPAQFTDIVTSIASGQQPLTVFLQQGGQLKDMFGGAGNAARAMAGYVAGLVTPFTLAGGAAAALGLAWYQAEERAAGFASALILSGNAAGATVGQLAALSDQIVAMSGVSKGTADDIAKQLGASSKIAKENFTLVGVAAAQMQRETGRAVAETVKEFEALGKDPVKAVLELNEKYLFLNDTLYKAIKAAQDEGDAAKAAALAQRAWAEEVVQRTSDVEASLGTLEKGWRSVAALARSAWSAMNGGSAQDILGKAIAAQQGVIQRIRDGQEAGDIGIAQAYLVKLEEQQRRMTDGAGKAAVAVGEAAKAEENWAQIRERNFTRAQQIAAEEDKIRKAGIAAKRSEVEIEREVARMRERLAEKAATPRTRAAGKSQEVKDAEELERILSRINGNSAGLDASYYTDLQKLFKAYGGGKLTLDQYRDAVEKLTTGQKFYTDILKTRTEAEKDAEKAQSDYFANWQKYLGGLDQEAQKLEEQALLWGLGKQALADMALIRAEDTLAKARDNGVSDEYLAKLEQEVELRRRIAQATGQIEAKEANKKAAEDAAREWQRVSDDIARSLTDAIFSGGKDGWTLLVDTIKATVIRAYVQPVIQNGINSVLGSVIGAPAGQGGIFGSLGSAASLGAQAAGLSGLGAYTGTAGFLQLGSMASSFSTGLSAAAAGADLTAAIGAYQAAGMGATATSLGAGASAAGALGSSAGLVSGALSGVMTAAPYLAAGLLIAQQLGAFNGPTYHKGGAYLAGTDGTFAKATNATTPNFNLGWGAYTVDRSSGYDDAMLGISAALAKQIGESIQQYGGKALDLTIASRFASDNSDWSEGAYRVMDEWGNTVVEVSKRYTKDANKALTQFGEDSSRVLLAALQKADLNDEFDALFRSLDPLKASAAEIAALFEHASAIQQQIASITGGIDAAFLSPTEQLDKAFAALGQSIPGTVQAYEALVRAQDLQTAGGRQLAADLLGNYQLWQQVTSEAEKAAAAAADLIANQRAGLEQQLMQALGDTAGLRALELAKLDESNRALQERIWASQDEASAAEKAAAAIEKAAASADAVASQRAGLERQIMEIMGDTQGIRTLELSALDQSNRALQERIWAIKDETEAQKQAAQAMEQIRATYDRITTGVSAGFDDSIRNVRLSVLDNEGKYSLLDSEAARYRDMLMSVSDPQLLESYAGKLKATLDQSYGLLTPEQQKETADEFVARYQQANDLVLERLQQSQDRAIKDQQAMSDAVKAAVVSAAEQAAQIIRAAGAAVPERVSVAVSVTADPGLSASTEVGY